MKLVITYSVGDGFTFSAEVVLCFEYESAEKFYCDLEEKLKEQRAAYKAWRIVYDDWQAKRPNPNHTKEWLQWSQDCPLRIDNEFEIEMCGYNFQAGDFWDSDDTLRMPEIMELNEWFKGNCINHC